MFFSIEQSIDVPSGSPDSPRIVTNFLAECRASSPNSPRIVTNFPRPKLESRLSSERSIRRSGRRHQLARKGWKIVIKNPAGRG